MRTSSGTRSTVTVSAAVPRDEPHCAWAGPCDIRSALASDGGQGDGVPRLLDGGQQRHQNPKLDRAAGEGSGRRAVLVLSRPIPRRVLGAKAAAWFVIPRFLSLAPHSAEWLAEQYTKFGFEVEQVHGRPISCTCHHNIQAWTCHTP